MNSKFKKFSYKDLYNIFKKKGFVNLLIFYKENILFDFINKTNTCFKHTNHDVNNEIIPYQPSFTKTIKDSIKIIMKDNNNIKNYNFVDVGCGAGKSLIIANRFNFKNIIGIEINKELFQICKNNTNPFKNIHIINTNILSYEEFQNNSIYYLFNPFGFKTLKSFHEKISSFKNIYIIYNNYEFSEDFFEDYNILYQKKVSGNKFENENLLILKNN